MARASRTVLIVENGHNRGEAIGRMAKIAGLEVQLARAYRGEPLPRPQSARVIILTGGPGSVCDPPPSDSAFLGRVLEFTQLAIERWTPIIGICLGHQMIARALNGKVVRRARREVGIRRIYPLLSAGSENAEGSELRAFVFHQDHVPEAPPGCTVTFRSDGCAVQGFNHRERPLHGLQFHPEIAGPQAQSILRWWYSENIVPFRKLDDAAAFDAKPAQELLLNLIRQYTVKTTVGGAVSEMS